MVRSTVFAVLVVLLAAGLVACSANPTQGIHKPGVLTGTAQACSGVLYVPTATLDVYRVPTLPSQNNIGLDREHATALIGDSHGVVLVATKKFPNDSTYRFVLRPGHYYITNVGHFQPPLGYAASIASGRTSQVDVLGNYCM
jgi:hypothetical protein